MRTAIISDIHANLIGFRAFLDAVERLSVQRTLCLGDIVGYNPWPNECIQIIRDRSIACVMGNHDRVAARIEDPDNFNAPARQAILWTRSVLTEENRDFLAGLPDRRVIDDSTIMVHGSPRNPDEYILTTKNACENMVFMKERFGASLGFFGHTHLPGVFDLIHESIPIYEGKTSLKETSVYLINPGSIGQPRDGNPGVSFLVYDNDEKTLEFFRVSYDIDAVFEAIGRKGLSPYLGKRLFLGV
ncbi:MAG: metallophosphoesterase family protein [Deltaproteobacteria bacterium]|nr:metallophosphoesterase family protein [Candidatus Zymogenaceae bacterium]